MAALTPIRALVTGTTKTMDSAAALGDTAPNPNGNLILEVANGSGGSITVTITAVQTTRPAEGPYPKQTVADIAVSVGAGATKLIGPIPTAFNDANGNIAISYSGTTSVTVKAIQP
ncbi:MAG: hypothetical protein L6Q35_00635 [Phycisphaerales bacterium]|nr:hypothetical protein [Phycisphaerales bacterium]